MKKFAKFFLFVSVLYFYAVAAFAYGVVAQTTADPEDFYTNSIKPIFDNRCVACHACYDSPCNLVLTSYSGVKRGGHTYDPYGTRLGAIEKQRMGKDALTEQQWRAKGFHPVVESSPGLSPDERVERSLLASFVKLGAENNVPGKIQEREAPSNEQCVTSQKEFSELFKKKWYSYLNPFSLSKAEKIKQNSALGMPFGLPALEQEQVDNLVAWIKAGSPGPTAKTREAMEAVNNPAYIKIAEDFLNRGIAANGTREASGGKYQWTAKYLYEHLFMVHLYHESSPGDFFELVRSSTKEGPVKEIVTDFPYDDPGELFWYRLKKVTDTLAYKNHIVYSLDDEKFNRINELFIESPWPDEVANGGAGIPSVNWNDPNPFVNFKPVPAKLRYKWLIENSKLIIDLFTRGPVCNGGAATYAVRDYFWSMFMAPDSDISVNVPGFFDMTSGSKDKNGDVPLGELLMVPAFNPNQYAFPYFYSARQHEYERYHAELLAKHFPDGFSEKDIWDGVNESAFNETSHNRNALLTIYRHDLSVSVHEGRMGNVPKTAWVIDYPVFERTYYNLVAAFDVYGSMVHKLRARVYMERLRREAEDNFLTFLPQEMRMPVRKSWYQRDESKDDDETTIVVDRERKTFYPEKLKTQVQATYADVPPAILGYEQPEDLGTHGPEHAGRQFMRRMTDIVFSKGTAGYPDQLNDHKFSGKTYKGELPETVNSWRELIPLLTRLADVKQPFVKYFKDVSYITFTREDGKEPIFFTVIANKSHRSMNVLFGENQTRDPENDTLHFVEDLMIAYPNKFYEVPLVDVPQFIKTVEAMDSENKHEAFEVKYGIKKSDERFWSYYDRLQRRFVEQHGQFSGILDLNRYGDID
ncbi:fatty acid cis/trans isomerase [Pseudomonadota bacterium]